MCWVHVVKGTVEQRQTDVLFVKSRLRCQLETRRETKPEIIRFNFIYTVESVNSRDGY